MDRFEYFDKGFARVGMDLGVVSIDDFTKFIRYKVYLDFISEGHSKTTAVILTVDRCQCCRATVYNSIKFFVSKNH